MKSKKVICVLGGIGPQASLYMCKLLIEMSVKFFGVKNNADFPEIILDSIPVPGFISNDCEKEIAFKMLKKRIVRLSSCNVLCFGIACNTAHVLFGDFQAVSKIPFLSMIEEVVKKVGENKIKKVGLLASPSTVRYELYQNELIKQDVKTLLPSEKEQSFFEDVVKNVLEEKTAIEDEKQLLAVANSLKRRGAEGIILGCTELPLVFPKKYSLPVYNSVEILAMALLQKYYQQAVPSGNKQNTMKHDII